MRKILSLVLVLSLVLGSFGTVFAAPKDVEGTDYEDAVTRLSALEILSGFPDGTFRPNETVTRAQCAKIMIHALGVGDAAKYAEGETKFSDVPASHWAAGYINVATDMNIINGYGDGNFGPEDKVTYAQAVTMIVRVLGFEPKAQAIGGYPGGYLAIAAEEDITDDINVVNTLAATRGDVALMVDNALTVPMMYQKTWGQFPEYANDDEDKTLMKTKLGVDEISGVVAAIPNTDSYLDENEIRIKDDEETEKYDLLVDGVNFDSLLGLEVTVWADGDDILDYDIDTDEDDILFDTVDKDSTKDEITLYVEDDTFEWAKDAKAYVNFEEVDLDEVPQDAYGYAVLNEKEEVAYVNVFDFNEVAVGVVYDVDGDVFSYVEPDAKTDELELSDYEDGVFIYNEEMELVDDDEIDVDSSIFAWETSDELYLVVKNDAVKGTLERIKDAEVRIDDTTYDKSVFGTAYSDDDLDSFDEYNVIDDIETLGDESITAVLDLNGELLFIYGDSETTSSTMYGVVTYAELGSKAEAAVFTEEGEEVDYIFEDRADAKGIEQGNSTNNIDYFEKSGDGLVFSVMKFKLNRDGEIDSDYITDPDAVENRIDIIDFTQTTELLKDDDKSYVWIDSDGDDDTNDRTKYYISEDTVFMTALDNDGYLDPAVLDYEDIYESKIVLDDAGTDTLVYVYGEPGKDADFILFLDRSFTGFDDEYYYGVVTESPWKDGGDYVATIDVFGEGEDEYVVANEEHFTEGKVVKFHYNIDGEIVRDDVGNKDNDGNFDYDDGYLTNTDNGTVKISSKAVVYELDSDGDIDDTVSVSKVDDSRFETLIYILDEDEMVVAATVQEAETVITSDAEATITGDYLFDEITDKINVKLTLATNTTPPDSINNYLLMVYEAPSTYVGGFLFSSDVITTNGQNFSCTDLNLSDKTDYIIKVVTMSDQEVLAEKSIITLNPTEVANQNAVNAARDDLDYADLTFTGAEDKDEVKGDIILPTTLPGHTGVSIAWTANTVDGATVASDGTVTRSNADNQNDVVTLIATLTKGTYTATKDFTVTIVEEKPPGTPTNFVAADDVGATTISLSWTDQSSDTDLDHFEIYYKVGSVADADDNAVNTNIARATTSESFDAAVASLNDSDNVYFAIYAVDAYGNKVKADANAIYQSSNVASINLDGVGVDVAAGNITGTTTEMEYSLDSSDGTNGTWTACTDTNTAVTFAAGKVYVRQANKTTNFRLVATIAAQAGAPEVKLSDDTSATAKIQINTSGYIDAQTSDRLEYSLDGGTNWNDVLDGTTVDASGDANVIVRVKATASALESAASSDLDTTP